MKHTLGGQEADREATEADRGGYGADNERINQTS